MPKLIKDGRIVQEFGYNEREIALCNQAARARGGICQMDENNPQQNPNPNMAQNDGRYPSFNPRVGNPSVKRGYKA